MQSTSARRFSPIVIVLIAVLVVCLVGGVAGGLYLVNTYAQIRDVENAQSMQPTLPDLSDASQTVKNPISFAALGEENPDVYAWIYIPGTSINYPVCQSADNDAFYLTHNAKKEDSELGAVFSESQFNGKGFQDRVTILYGHNGYGDTMFTPLHNFERSEFFNGNDKVYVYTADRVRTYQVISSFMSDDQHLMGLYNFQDDSDFARFLQFVQNPSALGAQVRPVNLGADSKILVLSTCNTGALEATGRYLVCGVMVDDRPAS
ncbi:MAG TPA: class B sortase [Eggerthellaceae bacterium]|nr:class B sortase [Eggerthellaceae bacterium]